MKWDALKRQVAAAVACDIQDAAMRDWETVAIILVDKLKAPAPAIINDETLDQYAAFAERTIMMWDVRCVENLRDLFPQHFPKALKTGRLRADYGEAGWEVSRMTP